MKRALLAAALLVPLLVAVGATSAAASERQPDSRTMAPAATIAATAATDGCAETGAPNTGWTCPQPDYSPTGYCIFIGCWNRLNIAEAEFKGVIKYGYRDSRGRQIQLGTVTVRVVDKLYGGTTKSTVNHMENDSTTLRNGLMEAERYYYSAACKANGCRVNNGGVSTYKKIGPSSRARDVRLTWGPPTYDQYAGVAKVAYGMTWHKWRWSDDRYRGTFWAWTKGPKVQRVDNVYKFMLPLQMADENWDSGWIG